MSSRRSLVDGLEQTPELKSVEEAFVYGKDSGPKPLANPSDAKPTPVEKPISSSAPTILPQMAGRVPVTIRCKPELASAIKRISLQRQLDGTAPYHMQDILEAALEQWLETNGYSPSN
ncbi:MAG: hypothetical protein KDB27_21095 [Planctomycetales bacterium]|nr:hypothetical protein [Planctomycetales bacterium]